MTVEQLAKQHDQARTDAKAAEGNTAKAAAAVASLREQIVAVDRKIDSASDQLRTVEALSKDFQRLAGAREQDRVLRHALAEQLAAAETTASKARADLESRRQDVQAAHRELRIHQVHASRHEIQALIWKTMREVVAPRLLEQKALVIEAYADLPPPPIGLQEHQVRTPEQMGWWALPMRDLDLDSPLFMRIVSAAYDWHLHTLKEELSADR